MCEFVKVKCMVFNGILIRYKLIKFKTEKEDSLNWASLIA